MRICSLPFPSLLQTPSTPYSNLRLRHESKKTAKCRILIYLQIKLLHLWLANSRKYATGMLSYQTSPIFRLPLANLCAHWPTLQSARSLAASIHYFAAGRFSKARRLPHSIFLRGIKTPRRKLRLAGKDGPLLRRRCNDGMKSPLSPFWVGRIGYGLYLKS